MIIDLLVNQSFLLHKMVVYCKTYLEIFKKTSINILLVKYFLCKNSFVVCVVLIC